MNRPSTPLPQTAGTDRALRHKNKTLAAWLAFVGGPLGLHRFYLHGLGDWLLIPLLGFTIAGCALRAILYGLTDTEAWNRRHNPGADVQAPAGRTGWPTIFAIALSLMIGAAVLMASIAYSFQHYFEYQVEEARKISQ
jgi:hypothetical protein